MPLDSWCFSRKTPACVHFIKHTEQCALLRRCNYKRWKCFQHTHAYTPTLKNPQEAARPCIVHQYSCGCYALAHTEPSCGTSHCSFVFSWLVELLSAQDHPSIPSAPAAHTSLTRTLTTCKVAGLFFYPVQMKSPQTIHRPFICTVSVPDMDHRSSSSFY